MKRAFALSSLTAVAAIAVACSSNKPNPPATPIMPTDAGTGGDGGPVTAPPPDGGLVAADAGSGPAMPTFFTDAGSGTPTAPAMTEQAMDIAIDALLAAAATKNAPKMAEEGQPGHTTMKENDHWAMMINMQPNRCYTIIATALPGTLAQIDLHLYGPPFYNVEAGKSGAQDKALPIIGKGTAALCPILPLAVPYKLDVVATKGAGRMGVKVYSRSK